MLLRPENYLFATLPRERAIPCGRNGPDTISFGSGSMIFPRERALLPKPGTIRMSSFAVPDSDEL